MTRSSDLLVEHVRRDRPPPGQLASWYTQGHSDGFGDRLLMSDNTGEPSLELLRFRPELALAPGFERALRDRVARLSHLHHGSLATVRAVERLEPDHNLALVSTYTPGRRLSEAVGRARGPGFALSLIRQITPALATLQQEGSDVAHGAVAANRITVTPDGRLVILEHVLGSAIDALDLPASRLWSDLGLIVPATGGGEHPRIDGRTDIVQLALIALALMLGRRVRPEEYPGQIPQLLDDLAHSVGRYSPTLFPPLRRWVERALQVRGPVFESTIDANEALDELPDERGPHSADESARKRPQAHPSRAPERSEVVAFRPQVVPVESVAPSPHIDVEPIATPSRHGTLFASIGDQHPPALEAIEPTKEIAAAGGRTASLRSLVAVLSLCVIGEAAWIVRCSTARIRCAAFVRGHGAIAGRRRRGVRRWNARRCNPARRQGRCAHPIDPCAARRCRSPRTPRRAPLVRLRACRRRRAPPPSLPAANPSSQAGGIRLSSPVPLQVLEGDRVLGSTATGSIVLSAGRHELQLVNNAVGYSAPLVVDVRAGQVATRTISLPAGRMSVNALPWAEVWIDGKPVGETPLGNLSVSLGEHTILFRHPQFGEHRQTALVRSDALARISIDLRR